MCRMFVVQVRCMHVNGTGYWSEWSDSVDSTPQNSRGTVHLTVYLKSLKIHFLKPKRAGVFALKVHVNNFLGECVSI